MSKKIQQGQEQKGGIRTDGSIVNKRPPDELILFSFNRFSEVALWVQADGCLVYANDSACEKLGYAREELLQMHMWDIDPNLHRETWDSHWADLRERKGFRFESEHRTKRGIFIPVETSINYINYNGSELLFAFSQDLTNTKRSERLLTALTRAGKEIASASSYPAIFEAAANELRPIDCSLLLLLLDDDKQHFHIEYMSMASAVVKVAEKLIGLHKEDFNFRADQIKAFVPVLRHHSPVFIDDIVPMMQDSLPSSMKGFARKLTDMFGFETLIALPFLVEDEFKGILSIQGRDLTKHDIPGLTAFAQHVAAACNKADLYGVAQQEMDERSQIEIQLREERDRAQNYIDIAAVLMLVVDQEGKIRVINQRGLELLGCGETDLQGMDFVESFIPEAWKQTAVQYFQALEESERREKEHIELPVRSKCGREYSVQWRFSDIKDAEGEVTSILASGEDITDRKRTEDALRESEERFRKMADSISDGLTLIEDGNIHYVNNRLCEILGYSREAIMKMILLEFSAPEEKERVSALLKQIEETGDPGEVFELWIEREDGSRRYIQNRYSKDTRADVPNRYYIVTTDMTARKLADEDQASLLFQIQEQVNRIQQVIDTIPVGVILLDKHFLLLQSNELGKTFLNRVSDVRVGESISKLGDQPMGRFISSEEPVVWQDVVHGDHIYEVAAKPLLGVESPEGWVLIVREVTRVREESAHVQQQERLASVGLLAGGIAHDFNNALMPITLYAEILLMDQNMNERSHDRLETILTQAKHAGKLTQQILDFSRRSILERIALDLSSLVREQVRLLRRTFPENIRINLDYDRKNHMVSVDATRIQQALMNLALNARDAMPDGGELNLRIDKISITEEEESPVPTMSSGNWVRLTVRDTGGGIREEDQERIFEPFFTTKDPGMGSGLGLAQVYGIVMQHGGQIEVQSEEKEGTTFILYFPELKMTFEPPSSSAVPLPLGRGETILVVEDDPAVSTALSEVLETLNYVAVKAAHGLEALDIIDANPAIALILSDMVMPEMGGKELVEILEQRGSTTPIVLMTGHPLQNELDRLAYGILSGWMMKSAGTDKLARTLADILNNTEGDRTGKN